MDDPPRRRLKFALNFLNFQTIMTIMSKKNVSRRVPEAAVRSSVRQAGARPRLADVRGWLAGDDPLFGTLDEIRRASRRRGPRALRNS